MALASSLGDVAADVGLFAERVLGRPLWPHQLELAQSGARYRVVCAGRQVGKSTTLSVIALHTAATRRNATVLLVSAGETASRRLLEDCAAVAMGSRWLRGSVLDESKSALALSNGSRILSVPASMRQIRGWPVDLLVVDEAGFVDTELWRAAEPAIIARPGSRVILSSTPWGGVDHFFRQLWQRGMDSADGQLASFHWPSSVSPLVDRVLLEQIRARESSEYFRREFLAEWTDESGAFLSEADVMGAVADYSPLSLGQVREASPWDERLGSWGRLFPAAFGVDWGQRDENAVVGVAPLEDFGANAGRLGRDGLALFIPYLRAASGWAWDDFIDHVVDAAGVFRAEVVASEVNGVGAYPTEALERRAGERIGLDRVNVQRVWTDVRRKQAGFSRLKGLLRSGRLVLPRDPGLLKQLRSLTFEQLPSGSLRISVPEAAGHDDQALALMQALSCVRLESLRAVLPPPAAGEAEFVESAGGVRVPVSAWPSQRVDRWWAYEVSGAEKGDVW